MNRWNVACCCGGRGRQRVRLLDFHKPSGSRITISRSLLFAFPVGFTGIPPEVTMVAPAVV
jgi:hypothetical protein